MDIIVQQPGSGRLSIHREAVEKLMLSQEDKPKRHRSAREISHGTGILRSQDNSLQSPAQIVKSAI